MIGLCVLTIGIVLGSLGIANSINSLQNVIIMNDMKKELDSVKKELDSKKDIKMYINSPGGSVYDGLGIIDTMDFIKPDIKLLNSCKRDISQKYKKNS